MVRRYNTQDMVATGVGIAIVLTSVVVVGWKPVAVALGAAVLVTGVILVVAAIISVWRSS
jgi:hypothetical protein